jgi:3,4-dihydroxy 2-butanone 4-phosphate synthase/GTP cyclohydrolase II
VTLQDLIQYRKEHPLTTPNPESLDITTKARLPVANGHEFDIHVFQEHLTGLEHVALCSPVKPGHIPLVRLHSECLTGDVLGSLRCDCGPQLHTALQEIGQEGGVLLYLRQEGRGIGLANKIKAYALQEQGMDTVDANMHLGFVPDARDYQWAARILKTLGFQSIRLMTNNPQKIKILESEGITVVERIPIEIPPHEKNRTYLETKRDKLGHLLKK